MGLTGPASRANVYSGGVLALSPALYWRLDDPSGTTATDSSGNSRSGTYGAGVTLGAASLLTSDADAAISLPGSTTGRVTSSYNPFLIGTTVTVVGVASTSSSTGQRTLFGGDSAVGSSQVLLRLEAGAPASVRFYPHATNFGSWTNAWPGNNQSVHWALTFNDTAKSAELFINGVSKGAAGTTDSYASPQQTNNFTVGVWASTFLNPFPGVQDDVAVFTSILTAAQILTLANLALGDTTRQPARVMQAPMRSAVG